MESNAWLDPAKTIRGTKSVSVVGRVGLEPTTTEL